MMKWLGTRFLPFSTWLAGTVPNLRILWILVFPIVLMLGNLVALLLAVRFLKLSIDVQNPIGKILQLVTTSSTLELVGLVAVVVGIFLVITELVLGRLMAVMVQLNYARVRKSDKRKNKASEESDLKNRAVTETYGDEVRISSSIALGTLFPLAAVLWSVGETSGAILSLVGGCIVVAHLILTRYRVSRGLFGSNAQEATELIQFIVRCTHRSGGPPGTRLSKAYIKQERKENAEAAKTANAIP
jgi:uncharacterized membrane protein YciS (DUF1049 family)